MRFSKYLHRVFIIFFIIVLIVPFNFLSFPKKAHAAAPSNPNASQNARMVLDYFYNLKSRAESGQTTNRVISGQQVPTVAFTTNWTDHVHHIIDPYAHTGKWIGIVGSEYWTEANRAGQVSTLNGNLINYWNNGNLVTLNWHARNPWTDGAADDRTTVLSPTTVNGLLANGTAENTRLKAHYDIIADYLTELKNAGVVVLWRPYHEMNMGSGGFWWGSDLTTQSDYSRLWQYMFNYFTNTKGLDNLLWLYAANNQWSATGTPVDFYYPGSAYVDIVGQDVYSFDNITLRPNANGSCNKLAALGKPFGISEEGPWREDYDGSWDNNVIIDKIKNECSQAVYFQQWNSWQMSKSAIIDVKNSNQLLNDPWVITRDEFTWQPPNRDTQAPAISSVAATPSTASPYLSKIAWNTNEDSTSVVKFGTSAGSYPNTAKGVSVGTNNGVASHAVYISGLQPNTTYYYVVNSTDIGGNTSQSAQGTFTTIATFSNTTFQPDAEGYIKNWAAIGAFLQTNCYPGAVSGTTCQPPIDEAAIQPSVGEVNADRFWIDLNSSATRIDINGFFYNMGKEIDQMQANQDAERALSYFNAYVYSASARTVQLRTVSDDGIKIRVNGNIVLDKIKDLGSPTENISNVTLNTGWNRLLIAVSDWSWSYSFSARFTNTSGNPITDLQIAINNPTASQMVLIKSADKAEARVGENITYTISWSNPTQQAFSNVNIDDNIPNGTTFISAANGGIFDGSKVTWNLGNLASGATGAVSFQVRVL